MFISKIKLSFIAILFHCFTGYSYTEAMQIGFAHNLSLEPSHRMTINQAAARLGEVISTTYDKPYDQRFDVVVRLSITELDGQGGTLAQAGPTKWFQSSHDGLFYPYEGEMEIDIADLNDPGLYNIVTHELIHVLGFGTLWEENNLVKLYEPDSPYFSGKKAIKAYSQLSGKRQKFVPLEKSGGSGTMGSHWRESIFNNELMTGYYNTDQINPLSKLTLAAFEDMGFEVNYSNADIYSIPSHRASLVQGRLDSHNKHPYHNCKGYTPTPTCCCLS